MQNVISYQGYVGQFSYEDGDEEFHGTVLGLNDVIHFRGSSLAELRQSLQDSVDDYLRWAAEEGRTPEKPYTGRFVVRIPPDLHRTLALAAARAGMSLNQWVAGALRKYVGATLSPQAHGSWEGQSARIHETPSTYETGGADDL